MCGTRQIVAEPAWFLRGTGIGVRRAAPAASRAHTLSLRYGNGMRRTHLRARRDVHPVDWDTARLDVLLFAATTRR
jgi:hypothetical protein